MSTDSYSINAKGAHPLFTQTMAMFLYSPSETIFGEARRAKRAFYEEADVTLPQIDFITKFGQFFVVVVIRPATF